MRKIAQLKLKTTFLKRKVFRSTLKQLLHKMWLNFIFTLISYSKSSSVITRQLLLTCLKIFWRNSILTITQSNFHLKCDPNIY